ncbi:MAG: hypothetical protein PVSMB4_13540 [Ktedonobacterales bacterium]
MAQRAAPIGGLRFDWVMAVVCSWPLLGAYLDAWAHNHIRLETFFTPWHAVLYSGFLAVAVTLAGVLLINHARGARWRNALPAGYELSLLGVLILGVGGAGDLLWHLAFGIEQNIDAALSPTHLLLALGIGLVVSGPLRAAWRRDTEPPGRGWRALLPMVVSLTLTLSLITLITQYAHPVVVPWAASDIARANPDDALMLGVLGILVQTGVLMGIILAAMRRWELPVGALTLIFTLNLALLSFMRDAYWFLPVAVIAGLVADSLLVLLRPSALRPGALHLFAFVVPTTYYLVYFVDLILTQGTRWSIHAWLGSSVMAGIVGWLLSYLTVPPAGPREQTGSSRR